MKLTRILRTSGMSFTTLASLGALMVSFSAWVPRASAFSEQNGQVHITKLCPQYTGKAGDHCTIATSDVSVIPPGTTVYYDQALGVPAGNLDSNIMLYVGTGNWAVGRCTVDFATGLGLCTLSDGVGPLAGLTARMNVRVDFATGITYWDGTYSFDPLPIR